jgi:tetratricopeptide (TPR) repeat protein
MVMGVATLSAIFAPDVLKSLFLIFIVIGGISVAYKVFESRLYICEKCGHKFGDRRGRGDADKSRICTSSIQNEKPLTLRWSRRTQTIILAFLILAAIVVLWIVYSNYSDSDDKSTTMVKEKVQETSQGITAADLVRKALDLWVEGKYSDPREALGYLDEALRLKPDFAEAYKDRGNAYWNLNEYSRAIQDFGQALRLKPDFAEAYTGRGCAYNGLGQYSRAIQDLDQGLRLKPDFAEAYNNRGFAYTKLGQYSRAIQDFDQALRLKPELAEAYGSRGAVHLTSGDRVDGCSDVQKACELGQCGVYEDAKEKGYCR